MLTGASVLILEIVGARLIAPFFGTSTYVWTAMIGVILGALSIGYWIGGKAADKDNPKNDLSLILIMASVLVVLSSLFHEPILELISKGNFDLRISALLAALVLFSIPSALVGMISPHLAKIRLDSLENSGETIGRLEAAGAIGSILGTFISGYFLLSYFGSREISMFLAIILIGTSFLADTTRAVALRVTFILITFVLLFSTSSSAQILLDKDSAYTRYQVVEGVKDGKKINLLKTDNKAVQSAYFPDYPNEPALGYAEKTMSIIEEWGGELSNILVIGGGAHTLPTLLNAKYPESLIQVVEIDPALDEIAIDYFGYTPNDKINIAYEDGRTFLNKSRREYDLIIVDAYSSSTIPFHLTTYETAQRLSGSLVDNGLIIANAVSRQPEGMLTSIIKTYEQFFYTEIFSAKEVSRPEDKNNYLVLATKAPLGNKLRGQEFRWEVEGEGIILRDNFAPVEKFSY